MTIFNADIITAARAVMTKPAKERRSFAYHLVGRMNTARSCVRREGKTHPEFGNGTLSSAAYLSVNSLADEGNYESFEWCDAVRNVINAVDLNNRSISVAAE